MAEQIGVKSSVLLGLHNHSSNPQGGQLNPETALFPPVVVDFGDGSDGDVTIAAGVTILARDMSYDNLIIQNGGQLCAAGYTIRVRGKLTINLGGIIWSTSGNLVTGQNGAAGVGGAGGSSAFSTRRGEKFLPTGGGDGADSGVAGLTTSVGGAGGAAAWGASNLIPVKMFAGAGGGGGGAIGNAPAAGDNALPVILGAGGGTGGNAQRIVGNHTKAGGGGGAGGGLIEIIANEIENNGTINAGGFAGGNGEGDANAQAGGGGGGGGGAVLIYYKTATGAGAGVLVVAGGAGGTSFGGVADGSAGAAGFTYILQVGT